MPGWRILPLAGFTVLLTVAVSGQANKWYDPYQRGLKALEAKNYESAVMLLQQAVTADPKAGASKYVEGVFRADYFPYYYLGIAYLELRQYEKAQEYFTRSRNGLSRPLLIKLDDYQKRLTSESALAARGRPSGPSLPTGPPAPNPAFEPAIRSADTALAAKRYADAVAYFDIARKADSAEFARENVQSRRDEAARAVAGLQLAEEGRQLVKSSQLKTAQARFEQANQMLPGQKPVTDGLAEVKQRQESYQRFRDDAEQNIRVNNLQEARSKLDQARAADTEQFNVDNLEVRVRFVNDRLNAANSASNTGSASNAGNSVSPGVAPAVTGDIARQKESQRLFDRAMLLAGQGKYAAAQKGFADALAADAGNQAADAALKRSRQFMALRAEATELARRGNVVTAQQRLTDARNLDSSRFDREGLGAILDRPAGQTGQEPDKTALRTALLALLDDNPRKSIAILEPVLAGRQAGSDPALAALYAYLGVAYATEALSSANQGEPSRLLREKARVQFRLAVSAQRNYQLSPRLVSPRILALFEQVRAG
jgi:tetratricopeptide (TPR) repeat protein